MATHTVIEIPKTTSGPADPRAPSILTTLPPEIRNRIYEYLFKRDGPIVVDDGQAHVELLVRGHGIHYTHSGVEQQVRDEDLCDVFADCTDLLLSCRQVYHEAVGVLYGENTFFFSQFLERQMHFTCTWLSRIGSHYQLLSRVSIEAKSYSPRDTRQYELFPLLKLVWSHPQAKCKFTFVRSGSSLFQEQSNSAGLHNPVTAACLMNRVLLELGTADVLNLRQYAKYSGLISSIMICYHQQNHWGYVEYNYPIARSFPDPERRFDILDHGSKVQWKESEQLNLLSLPDEFLSAINAYARTSDTDVTFDLDTKKARGYHVGLSGVNTRLRDDIDLMNTRVYGEIMIRMSTQEDTTDFNGFKALQEMLDIDNFSNLIVPYFRREGQCPINMVLMFKLSTPKPAADLRINITKLLHTFTRAYGDLTITIQGSDSGMSGTRSITRHHIQSAVLLLLSDVLEQYPSEANRPLPNIWMNGHGTVLRATYRTKTTSEETITPCSYAIDDPIDLLTQGHRRVNCLDQGGILKHLRVASQQSGPSSGSLFGMWFNLRYSLGMCDDV
ncbi:uncharacterized protein J4E88_008518 [Alternaria novae-zelandiae]|uniref:uncharacterized protein n=1 Tax=Alternaria novae-zelandiae TaxID=430562 RepID=UPI0020C1DC28|nr:uncharacterized protein J4E88_008518 [Alternaria novae-zelandiae]KAI4674051.1 hypothetical protein J4E88_008518 [Alternaria novae-zelandiae]